MRRFLIGATAIGFCFAAEHLGAKPASRLAGVLPGKTDTGHRIDLEATVACTPEKSFAMWSTREGVKSFYAPEAEIENTPAGKYTVMFFPDEDPKGLVHGTEGAHVLATEPNSFFAFEWVVFAGDDKKGRNAPPYAAETLRRPDILPTWVELSFTPVEGGTHVAFHHFGFGDDELWARSREWFAGAWTGVLTQMTAACAKEQSP